MCNDTHRNECGNDNVDDDDDDGNDNDADADTSDDDVCCDVAFYPQPRKLCLSDRQALWWHCQPLLHCLYVLSALLYMVRAVRRRNDGEATKYSNKHHKPFYQQK